MPGNLIDKPTNIGTRKMRYLDPINPDMTLTDIPQRLKEPTTPIPHLLKGHLSLEGMYLCTHKIELLLLPSQLPPHKIIIGDDLLGPDLLGIRIPHHLVEVVVQDLEVLGGYGDLGTVYGQADVVHQLAVEFVPAQLELEVRGRQ